MSQESISKIGLVAEEEGKVKNVQSTRKKGVKGKAIWDDRALMMSGKGWHSGGLAQCW
jgi:hypothetical protein